MKTTDCGKRLDGNAVAGCLCDKCVARRNYVTEKKRAERAARPKRTTTTTPELQALKEVADLVAQ